MGLWWKLAVSLVLLGWLARRYGGDPGFRATLARLDAASFLTAEAAVAGGLVLSALRWRILLGAAGVPLGLGRAIRLYLVGYFFNFFLPTTVGGDVVRAMGVGRGTPLPVVAGSIVVERLVGFASLLAIGIVASFAVESLAVARKVLLVAGAVFAVATAVLLFAPVRASRRTGLAGRVLAGLSRTALEVRAYGFRPRSLAVAALLSLGWQAALVASNTVLSQALGGVAPLRSLLTLVPVVQAVTMIPVSFGGLGVREMGYELFFRESGLDPAGAVALGVAFLGVTVALALKGGLAYLVAPLRGREA
jgi:uncharacterized protein (TIRG00374 family)